MEYDTLLEFDKDRIITYNEQWKNWAMIAKQ